MISRVWGAVVKREHASAYIAHLQSETFPKLRALAGHVDASINRRDVPDGVEFVVITRWQSLDSIRAFAGSDVEAAVVPPAAQAMMVTYDARVRHYEIVA
jgi:heme-degrading monooxygenase HmoA